MKIKSVDISKYRFFRRSVTGDEDRVVLFSGIFHLKKPTENNLLKIEQQINVINQPGTL